MYSFFAVALKFAKRAIYFDQNIFFPKIINMGIKKRRILW